MSIKPHSHVLSSTALCLTLLLTGCSDSGSDPKLDGGKDLAVADMHLEAGSDGPQADTAADQSAADAFAGDAYLPPGKWVSVTPQKFTMGSPSTEPCRSDGTVNLLETQHEVTLNNTFEITAHEVTQDEYQQVMGIYPSGGGLCNDCPVKTVSWHMAVAYCNKLSLNAGLESCYENQGSAKICSPTTACAADEECLKGICLKYDLSTKLTSVYQCKGYRLPTEAEWEFSYRAGTTTAYYSGANDASKCEDISNVDTNADAIGWYQANAKNAVHTVGGKQANALGLFDMAGNVSEWVHDWSTQDLGKGVASDPEGPASGAKRVVRGGSFTHLATSLRAAYRHSLAPTDHLHWYGFRCARTLAP